MTTSPRPPSGYGDSAARRGPIDPESPESTYAIEPSVIQPLVDRIATSHMAGEYRSILPFTGAPLASIPLSTPHDVVAAARRARAVQPAWADVPVGVRADVLDRLAGLILERRSDVLDLIQMESGKSRTSALEEVADVAQLARHYARRAGRYLAERRVSAMVPLVISTRVHRRAVGLVGIIAPWNFPLSMVLSDALPALVAGNAVMVKPDPQTMLTALWAAELCADAGLPHDVLQIVAGGGQIGEAVIDSVDHIVFTGSTETGRKVAARAGERLIGATLELGGKNALYVAADAHIPTAAAGAVTACFSSTGQMCVSIERILLHESIAERFLAEFVPLVRDLRVGVGLDYRAQVGSLTSAAQLDRVAGHVTDAVARGAQLLAGGTHRADLGPFVYAPTVLAEVPSDALCARNETFGPVVAVSQVSSDEDAVAAMNDSPYGLNASIWTADLARGRRLAARVRSGSVNVNDGYAASFASPAAPMGGMKASGLGRRHGRESIEAMTEAQTVAVHRGSRYGIGLERLYALPGDVPERVLTGALRTMRWLRLP